MAKQSIIFLKRSLSLTKARENIQVKMSQFDFAK